MENNLKECLECIVKRKFEFRSDNPRLYFKIREFALYLEDIGKIPRSAFFEQNFRDFLQLILKSKNYRE